MTGHPPFADHLDDVALAQLLDGAFDEQGRTDAERHVETCARCAQDLRELRASSALLSAALAAEPSVEVPMRQPQRAAATGRRTRVTPWAVAAALLLAAALAVGADPLLAFARELWRTVSRTVEARPDPAGTGMTARPERVLIELTPQSPDLILDFAARPRGGHVLVTLHDAATIIVTTTAAAHAGVTVLPERLRVRNEAASAHAYGLMVPATMRSVTITVLGEPKWSSLTSEIGDGSRRIEIP